MSKTIETTSKSGHPVTIQCEAEGVTIGSGAEQVALGPDDIHAASEAVKAAAASRDYRTAVVAEAIRNLGVTDPRPYWLDAYGSYPGPKLAWCGVFDLHVLRKVGLTKLMWRMGVGFLIPAKLRITKTPKPGDIAYFSKNAHHAIVLMVATDGRVKLCNGNGLYGAVTESWCPMRAVTAFYSIETLIRAAQQK